MGQIKNIIYTVGVVASLALAARGCVGMYRFSNAQELIEDYKATSNYLELKDLADVDRSGELSEVERKLLFARLDEYRYGGGGDHWLWEDVAERVEERVKEGGRVYWTQNDRSRISHALMRYTKNP